MVGYASILQNSSVHFQIILSDTDSLWSLDPLHMHIVTIVIYVNLFTVLFKTFWQIQSEEGLPGLLPLKSVKGEVFVSDKRPCWVHDCCVPT